MLNLHEAEALRVLCILEWLSDDIPHGKADRQRLQEHAQEALALMRNAVLRNELNNAAK